MTAACCCSQDTCRPSNVSQLRSRYIYSAMLVYTVSQKVPIFKLSVTLWNLNEFSKFLLKSIWNLLQNQYDYTHLSLRDVATLPWKIKQSNFSRYSADLNENTNKLHFKFTAFNFSMRVTLYAECIYVLEKYSKILSIQRCGYFFGKILWLWKEPVVVWLRLMAMSTVPVFRNFFNS